jgi:hypothetical protein
LLWGRLEGSGETAIGATETLIHSRSSHSHDLGDLGAWELFPNVKHHNLTVPRFEPPNGLVDLELLTGAQYERSRVGRRSYSKRLELLVKPAPATGCTPLVRQNASSDPI